MAALASSDRLQQSESGRGQGGPISWTPNHELDAREWVAAGRRIGAVGRCIQWLLGDWITYGNAKFGERYARASKITGYDVQTLMNMVYVASRFPISRRRENLSWSHHETLAAFEPTEQERWLDQASVHRWSVADLRMMLRTARDRHGGAGAEEEAAGPAEEAGDALSAAGFGAAAVRCPNCGEEFVLRAP